MTTSPSGPPTSDDALHRLRQEYVRIERDEDCVDLAGLARRARGRQRRARTWRAGGAVGLLAAAAVVVIGVSPGVDLTSASQEEAGANIAVQTKILDPVAGLQRFLSATGEDWVRNSDYVVQVTVTSESPIASRFPDDGAPGGSVGRAVRLSVDDVLWRRQAPTHPLAESISLQTFGWHREDGELTPVAYADTPRLEVGHSYVVALVWVPRACAPGDGELPAHWSTLGDQAVIPADGDRLGYGESEGRSVTGDVDQTSPGSLERRLLGRTPVAVAEALTRLPPTSKSSNVFPTPSC